MYKMTDNVIVDLSYDEDDDCVIQSVIYKKSNEKSTKYYSSLYHKVSKDSKLLADFIEKCLCLEKSSFMFNTLKNVLLDGYYKVEKSVRDGSKIQRALQRANNLLNSDPDHKYTHIKDLCDILKASQVKKKVPFITLTTDLKATDNRSETNNLKRNNVDIIDADSSKKPKLNEAHPVITDSAFDDTADSLDETVTTINCSQESCVSEEDSLLVAKKDTPGPIVEPVISANEEQIQKLQRKIAYYKREIARLDELEVDDDSINSPYIRSERLKSSVVILYKELCALTGSNPSKRKGIRLQVIEGHPPGPTRILEDFLNKGIDSNGDLSFPDFCDVVNCVTEANDKDDLGWTRAQVMKEGVTCYSVTCRFCGSVVLFSPYFIIKAYLLFTHCGRALQKRRQKREYRDLLCKVKIEDTQRDPADDDPELLARLEENKRISVKKESEILERFTMMQALPPKPKPQKQPDDNINNDINIDAQKILTNNNNDSSKKNSTEQMDVDIRNSENEPTTEEKENQSANKQIVNSEFKSKTDVSQETKRDTHIEFCNKDTINGVVDKVFSDKGNKEINNGSSSVTSTLPEDTLVEQNKILTTTKIKQEPEEDIMSMFKSLGENFSVTVETISDPFLIIEISDSSDDE